MPRRRRALARPRHRRRSALLRTADRRRPRPHGLRGPGRRRAAVPARRSRRAGADRSRPRGRARSPGRAPRRRATRGGRRPAGGRDAEATPWLCSSCPPSSARPSSGAPPRCPRSCTSPTASSGSSSTAAGSCPAPVQLVLLVAAAEDAGDLAVVRASRRGPRRGRARRWRPPSRPACWSPTARSCSVRHPLVRSAIYQAATDAQRRRVHRALAEALAGRGDPDRETWHRAAAAEGPDQEIVDALAERRRARGASRWVRRRVRGVRTGGGLTTSAPQRAHVDPRGRAQRLGLRTGRPRGTSCSHWRARPPTDPLLLADIARLRGADRGQHRLGHRRPPDLHRGRGRGVRGRPSASAGDGGRGRHPADLRRRQRRDARHRRPPRGGSGRRHTPHGVPQADARWR